MKIKTSITLLFLLLTLISFGQVDTIKKNPLTVTLGNSEDTILNLQEIQKTPNLHTNYKDSINEIEFNIISFKLTTINSETKKETTFNLTFGNELTIEQLNHIETMNSGDKLTFYDIKATCKDCAIRTLKPLTIVLK